MERVEEQAPYRIGALEVLIDLYEKMDRPDDAAACRVRIEQIESSVRRE